MAKPDFQLFSSLRYDPFLTTLPANTSSDPSTTLPPSPFYMPSLHRDRILLAAQHFNWATAASKISGSGGLSLFLLKLNEEIDTSSPQPLRVRVLLSHDGEITVESNPVPEVGEFTLFPLRIPPPKGKERMVEVSPLTGGALTLGKDDRLHGDPQSTDAAYVVLPDAERTAPSPYTTYKTTSRDMYDGARGRVGIQSPAERKEVLLVSEEGEIMEGSLTSVFFWRDGRWITPPLSSGGQGGTTRRWALERGLCVEGVVRVDGLVDGEECWISNGVKGFSFGRVKLS